MDTFLAQYFGTTQGVPEQATETDELEKMAQLVMLDKIASDQQIDLSGLSDEDAIALANYVFEDDGQEKTASDEELTEHEKIAAAKFDEATYLGKVVAHSMWNELEAIQKVAATPQAEGHPSVRKLQTEGGTLMGGGAGTPQHAPTIASGKPVAAMSDDELAKAIAKKSRSAKVDAAKTKLKDVAEAGWKGLKKHKGKAALIAGGTALAAGGAYAGKKALDKKKGEKSKEGSAMDTLSDARAYEILQEHGLADEQGNVVAPDQIQYEKTAADELAEAVELEAWEKLAALGYPVVNQ